MNKGSLQLGTAFNLLMRTMPIILVRLGVSIAFWLAALIYLGVTGGVSWLIGQAISIVGVILFFVAIVAMIPLYQLAYRYIFYMIKAAHIAVVSELLVRGSLPEGTNQLAWGKQRVTERFGEANVMFVVDQLVTGVVNAFTRTVYSVASWLPGDLRSVVRILNQIIRFAMSYIDEAILARSFYSNHDNVWANARDGLVLYGMTWKPILKTAVALMALSYVPFIVVFLVFSAPLGLLLSLISTTVAGWSLLITLVLAWMVKVAVGDAFAMIAIIAVYQRETDGLEPDPQMAARLESVSSKFTELKQKAGESIGGSQPKPKNDEFDQPGVEPLS